MGVAVLLQIEESFCFSNYIVFLTVKVCLGFYGLILLHRLLRSYLKIRYVLYREEGKS